MDITRNVGVRESVAGDGSKLHDKANDIDRNIKNDIQWHRRSLPNISITERNSKVYSIDTNDVLNSAKSKNRPNENKSPLPQPQAMLTATTVKIPKNLGTNEINDDNENDEECAVSGRLEIRVVQQQQQQHPIDDSIKLKASINNDEKIDNESKASEITNNHKLHDKIECDANENTENSKNKHLLNTPVNHPVQTTRNASSNESENNESGGTNGIGKTIETVISVGNIDDIDATDANVSPKNPNIAETILTNIGTISTDGDVDGNHIHSDILCNLIL